MINAYPSREELTEMRLGAIEARPPVPSTGNAAIVDVAAVSTDTTIVPICYTGGRRVLEYKKFLAVPTATTTDSILVWDTTLNYGAGGWKALDGPTTDGMILVRNNGSLTFDFPKYTA